MENELQRQIDERIKKLVPDILRSSGFSARKITDTPTDSFSVVNRKYVNNNGSVAGRPASSVASTGQFYLDTQSNIPMWKVTAGWVNGVGSVVSLNN